ncbi:hypothetical protein B0H66DRAFT_69074 [Apodospora peruviana]|uniref:Uncharacterized protein n=1 Tax=Apodospora peruviana TaxID=516989 RepID=A0AAE0MFH9_9PEZI|nr:hypothetical protein B0H66DRAFT_69074 [Apodospora peruviana]
MVSFPQWTTSPIPGVSLSAGGLLALADLSTVAQRTAITGGSSWLDALLLAPGLHYQQAAEELARGSADAAAIVNAVEDQDGKPTTFRINNAATAHYIRRIARPGQTVTLDVGAIPVRWNARYFLRRSNSGMHATIWAETDAPDLGWVSHLLYLSSPVLTVASLVLVVLLQDWWTLGSLLALMLARILNIWVIKQRIKRQPPPPTDPPPPPMSSSPDASSGTPPKPGGISPPNNQLTEYTVSLGHSSVRLRGTPSDLQAITSHAWLRAKTQVEGYFEAAAKLLVYLVAALSGNTTQAGAIVMMALLLLTAGLLALSNANAKSFQMNGRVALPQQPTAGSGQKGDKEKKRSSSSSPVAGDAAGNRVVEREAPQPLEQQQQRGSGANDTGTSIKAPWPSSSNNDSGSAAARYGDDDDRAEKGQVRHATSA